MTWRPRMRPEFEIPLPGEGEAVLECLKRELERAEVTYVGQVLPRHAVVQLPRERRSLLSPYLNLDAHEVDGVCSLRGRFSPRPNVWTGFMAVYGVLAMIGVCGLMYGLSELMLGHEPWALLVAPAATALIAFVYGAAVIGQGLTVDEMYELRAFVDRAVRDAFSAPAAGVGGQDRDDER